MRVPRMFIAGPAPAVAIGLVLRALVLLAGSGDDRFRFADSPDYLTVAGGLPGALWSPIGDEVPASLARGPALPILGWASGAPGTIVGLILVQCLLGAVVNVVLAHRLGARLGGPAAAGVAALVVAIDPVSIGHNLLVATETLAATLVLCVAVSLEAVVRDRREGRSATRAAVALGLAAGLAALTRPNLVVLVPFAALAPLVALPSRRVLAPAVLALAVGLAPVSLWVVRNDRVGGAPVLTTVAGQNLADFGLAAAAVERGRLDGWTSDRASFAAATEAVAAEVGLSPPVEGDTFSVETDARWRREGLALMADHPRGTAVVSARGVARTMAAPGDTLVLGQTGDPPAMVRAVSRASALVWILGVDLLAMAGVVASVRARRRTALIVTAGTALVVLASSLGPFLEPRFRVPVWPLVAVLAGLGVDALVDRRGRPATR